MLVGALSAMRAVFFRRSVGALVVVPPPVVSGITFDGGVKFDGGVVWK